MIKSISSRIVYKNKWLQIREDAIELPDGSPSIYSVIEKPDFAIIIPCDDDDGIYMVHHYRYPAGGAFWEFPQGSCPQSLGDLEATARKELQEETGLTARKLTKLGCLFEAYGYSDQHAHVYLAEELTPGQQSLEPEEIVLETRKFQFWELEQMIADGKVPDAATVAAYGLFLINRRKSSV